MQPAQSRFEFRVSCSVSMQGGEWEGDWQSWDGDPTFDAEQIKTFVGNKTYGGDDAGMVSQACDSALELAGFDYWIEVRDAS